MYALHSALDHKTPRRFERQSWTSHGTQRMAALQTASITSVSDQLEHYIHRFGNILFQSIFGGVSEAQLDEFFEQRF